MDETFKVVHRIFCLLTPYVLQIECFLSSVSCSQIRKKKTYLRMFDEIKKVDTRLRFIFKPKKSWWIVNAADKTLPNVFIKGCFFHYKTSLVEIIDRN